MTTLDRAFIKAYGGARRTAQPVPPAPLAEPAVPRPAVAPAMPLPVARPAVAEFEPRAVSAAPPARTTAEIESELEDLVPAEPLDLVDPEVVEEWPEPTTVPLSRYLQTASREPALGESAPRQPAPRVETRPAEPFRALLEVDRVTWPRTASEMVSLLHAQFQPLVQQIADRAAQGHKCAALSSCQRGAGRTMVALALAKMLTARGQRVVLVDADRDNPMAARLCGISVHTGWDDLISSDLAAGEALITAVEDNLTLMPWRGTPMTAGQVAASPRTTAVFETLERHFDVVLVDAGPLMGTAAVGEIAALAGAMGLDALYLVEDVRVTQQQDLAATIGRLRRAGLTVMGVIENYVSPASDSENSTDFTSRKAAAYR